LDIGFNKETRVNMGFCAFTSKSILGFLGLIFVVCAAVLWVMSGLVIATYQHYDHFVESKYTLVPAIVAIAVGIIFFFAGILGCCSMCKENRCVLGMFGVFMLVLLALLVAGAVMSVVFRADIEESVRKETHRTLDKYEKKGDEELTKQVNYIQEKLKCCGNLAPANWSSTDWGKQKEHKDKVPWSCCNVTNKDADCEKVKKNLTPIALDKEGRYWEGGCVQILKTDIKDNIKPIAGAIIGFAVLLVLGIISTCVLCCLKRREDTPYFSLN
jgi:Na+-transporting methylmalonyl-CoA/oxaloacetate decarboxylase gamma subunit